MICRIYRNGARIYKGYHRIDGPIFVSGKITVWYQNGKRHREDGPAVEYASGTKKWYKNGKPHRFNGPAVEYASGCKEWWIYGLCIWIHT